MALTALSAGIDQRKKRIGGPHCTCWSHIESSPSRVSPETEPRPLRIVETARTPESDAPYCAPVAGERASARSDDSPAEPQPEPEGTSCRASRSRCPSTSSDAWPAILLLGIISGFPWVLIGSSLSLWLKDDGLSRTAIGWAGLIFGVYAFNFLWAPLIDRIRVPWLTDRLGHRRAWIVTLQLVILLCLVAWSAADPTANLAGVIAIGLVIAIASATQDITIDALRIEQMGTAEGEAMAAGAATAVVG